MADKERLMRIGDFLRPLLAFFSPGFFPEGGSCREVWLGDGVSSWVARIELDNVLRPLMCLEAGGTWEREEEVVIAMEARGCGEEGWWSDSKGEEGGEVVSGLHRAITSHSLFSHKLLELWVRKMMTAPLRGPLGE